VKFTLVEKEWGHFNTAKVRFIGLFYNLKNHTQFSTIEKNSLKKDFFSMVFNPIILQKRPVNHPKNNFLRFN
jgi:hypothetical protein